MDFLHHALTVAMASEGKHRIGAVIVDKTRTILSCAHNSYVKTHPYQYQLSCQHGNGHQMYLHAEIAALVKCRKTPYAIYIARVGRNNEARMAKPCPICMAAIEKAGVKRVYYTVNENEIGEIRL